MPRSCNLWKKLNSGRKSIRMLRKSKMMKFLNRMTIVTSKVLISQASIETKGIVDHATLCHSPKSWRRGSSSSTENSLQLCHHRCWWVAITWTKDAMEAGLISTCFWRNLDMSLVSSVRPIKAKQSVIPVKTTRSVLLLPRWRTRILSEAAGEPLLKRRWWRKFWETVQSTEIFKLPIPLVFIKKAFSAKKG